MSTNVCKHCGVCYRERETFDQPWEVHTDCAPYMEEEMQKLRRAILRLVDAFACAWPLDHGDCKMCAVLDKANIR